MPDFGLTKALAEAVAEGASKAKVLRPAEQELNARLKARAAGVVPDVEPQMQSVGSPSMDEPAAVQAAAGGVDTSAEAPTAAPASVPEGTPAPELEPPATALNPDLGTPQTPPPTDPAAQIPPVDPAVQNSKVYTDAQRLSRANLGDYALDETHQPNFDTITTTDDIKAVIADLAERNKGAVEEARRGTITNDALQGLANDLDVSTDVVQTILRREDGGVVNAETALAARQVLNSSADRLRTLAEKISLGQATDVERVTFARQQQFHNEFFNQFMGARAEAGRLLNAFSIPVGSDARVAGRISEILQASGMDIDRAARAISMANDVSGITQIARGSLLRRSGRAAINLINRNFVGGILSGPPTHLVNSIGNAVFQAMNVSEMAVAARLGRFLSGDEHVQVGEALATLQGTVGATRDALRLGGRAMKTGQTLDGVLKYEATGGKTETLQLLPGLDKPIVRSVVKTIDNVLDLPMRALGASDEIFKTLAYRGDLQRQALLHVQAQLKAGKATLENAAQVARDFMENAPEEAQKAAEDWAHQVTFQQPLGPIGQKLTQFLRSTPLLTVIAPFVRTPGNIFKAAAGRSPLAVFSSKFWSDVQAGGRARDLALARFSMGSATAAAVAMYVADGKMTGGGPQDPKQRMLWMENGRRPYSIAVTNPKTGETTWHSYARLEPFASVLGATADTVEIAAYLNADTDELEQDDSSHTYHAGAAIIAGIMNNTGNKTFMKGISDFVELMNDPGRAIQNYTQMMVASMVPYSGLQRFIRNTTDPYLREAWTVLDKVKDNTPGLSSSLPPRLDLFGETREKNSGSVLGVMSPIPESPAHYDNVVTELTDVMDKTHQVPVTMPDKRIEGMRLNAKEYADLVRLSRAEPIFGGLNFHDKLDAVMASPVYQKAEPMYKAELLKSVQTAADGIGRAKLEKANPDFADRITAWRMQKNRLLYDK